MAVSRARNGGSVFASCHRARGSEAWANCASGSRGKEALADIAPNLARWRGGALFDCVHNTPALKSARFGMILRRLGVNVPRMKTQIHYDVGNTTLGKVLVAANDKGICAILLGDSENAVLRDLRARFSGASLVQDEAKLARALARVISFIETPSMELDLPLDPAGTEFQRRVWRALRRIPAGKTASYADIARRIDAPRSFR